MSGGVDSSVAAALLAEQGHDVIGLSMQLYDAGGTGDERAFGSCCSIDDLHDARRVASALKIPHYIVNFERQFEEVVVSNFVREYASGRTPLPCAHCNSDLKFATLADRSRGLGADRVATGHYARVERDESTGRFLLRRAVDPSKDQAYFLFSLTQEQLAHAVFPVGDRSKDSVREYARRRHLPVADKPDSQEICFIPDHDYARFVGERTPDAAGGAILAEDGRELGRHDGIHRFTVGQRKGLGLSGPAPAVCPRAAGRRPPGRRRSASLARADNADRVGRQLDPRRAGPAPLRVTAQIRHRHHAAPAAVRALEPGRAEVVFDTPQIAITPGQAVVFYDGDVVVGGGWID